MTKEWTDFSASDIPEETQNELMHLGQLGEARAWGVGRVVQHLVDLSEAEGFVIPRGVLYSAIAKCARTSAEGVRMWHKVFVSVPEEIRHEYQGAPYEPTFSQYRELLPYCATNDSGQWRDKIEGWLKYASDRSISPEQTDAMAMWLRRGEAAPPPAAGRLKRLVRAARKMRDEEDAPDPVRVLCRRFIVRLAEETAKLEDPDWLVEVD